MTVTSSCPSEGYEASIKPPHTRLSHKSRLSFRRIPTCRETEKSEQKERFLSRLKNIGIEMTRHFLDSLTQGRFGSDEHIDLSSRVSTKWRREILTLAGEDAAQRQSMGTRKEGFWTSLQPPHTRLSHKSRLSFRRIPTCRETEKSEQKERFLSRLENIGIEMTRHFLDSLTKGRFGSDKHIDLSSRVSVVWRREILDSTRTKPSGKVLDWSRSRGFV